MGEVVYVDKFGNLISNIAEADLPSAGHGESLQCRLGDWAAIAVVESYSDVDEVGAVVSGFGTLEVFLRQGNAAGRLNDPLGTAVAVEVV
jgi:S-adenosylmethionine hydrolase